MYSMFVTLEVSKLSGWLNADVTRAAKTQESKGGHIRCGMRCRVPGGGGAAGDRDACSVQRGGLDCRLGAGHGEERTQNMRYMFVTLDVSTLSG